MFTHSSYRAAIQALEADRRYIGTVTWDAGEGWKAEAYWYHGRIIQVSINPDGMRIV